MKRLANQTKTLMMELPIISKPQEEKITLMLLNRGIVIYRLEIEDYPSYERDSSAGDDDETILDFWIKEKSRKSDHTLYDD